MATPVRNIAPFINVVFTITSHWWYERVDPVSGQVVSLHRGLDIATSTNDPVYSMLTGHVHSKGFDFSQGNWIIICDDNPSSPFYGYATLYMHLRDSSVLNVGSAVSQNQFVGYEGTTGHSTGIHLHVEMQDISRFGWQWHFSSTKSDYLDPTAFMGIDNIDWTSWIYDGTPYVPPTPSYIKKEGFPWVLYSRKLRERRY